MLNRVIQKYILEKRSCVAWKIDQSNTLLFCEISPIRTSNNNIVFKIPEYSLEGLIEIIGSQDKILLLFEDEAVVEVGSIINFESNEEIEVKFLNESTQFDRRSSARFNFKKLIQVTIETEDGQNNKFYGHDLSDNGISVVLMQNQINKFKKSEKCVLKIGETNPMSMRMEVVSINKMKPFESERLPYSKSKVSFRFLEENESWSNTIRQLSGVKIQ